MLPMMIINIIIYCNLINLDFEQALKMFPVVNKLV